jgi:hypothetical protein
MAGDAVTPLQLTAHPTRQENVSDKTAVLSMGSNKWGSALCEKHEKRFGGSIVAISSELANSGGSCADSDQR